MTGRRSKNDAADAVAICAAAQKVDMRFVPGMNHRGCRECGGRHEWPVSLDDWPGDFFKNCLTDGEALVV
jgi:hypothetical protein